MSLSQDVSSESSAYDGPSQFDPYDTVGLVEDHRRPESVQPTSPGPAQSTTTGPGFGGTSGEDGEPKAQPSPQGPQEDPLPEFDPKYKTPFEGLLFLGRLTDTVTVWGHKIVVRTLTTEDLTQVSLVEAPFLETGSAGMVYQTAFVAASVVSVDGQPLIRSLNVDDSDQFGLRYEYVKNNWMPPVREAIYNAAFALEIKARQVLQEMGKASG